MTKRLTLGEFIAKAQQKHGDKFTYNNAIYINNSTKLHITCPTHGDFLQTPSDHLTGYGCPECRNSSRRFDKSDFVTAARRVHGDLYNYDKTVYVNSSTKVIITCPKHGDFLQTPNAHTSTGQGCKKCKNTKGENQIYVWLKAHKFEDFVAEKTFVGCVSPKGKKLRYDFYIPSHNTLIEFDGAQHFAPTAFGRNKDADFQQREYERTVLHDSIKTKYAEDNNMSLLRIRYDENVYDRLTEWLSSQ